MGSIQDSEWCPLRPLRVKRRVGWFESWSGSILGACGMASALLPKIVPMYTHWRVLTATKTESKARRVMERLETALGEDLLDVRIEPHHQQGHQVFFGVDHGDPTHAEAVVAAIECAQRVGGTWSLCGPVCGDFGMVTTNTGFPGIDLTEFFLRETARVNDHPPP